MGLGMGALQLDLSDTNSLAEAQARIAAYAAANPTPRWIVGRGWNQERWRLGRFPTAAELDAAVADRPVWLERVDGHAGWANSIGDARGRHHRRHPGAGGRPDRADRPGANADLAIFVDAAMSLMERAVPPPLPVTRDRALGRAQEILLSYGLTTVADMGTSAGGLGGDAPRRRRRPAHGCASSPTLRGSTICSPSPARGRRPGSMTGGSAWSA